MAFLTSNISSISPKKSTNPSTASLLSAFSAPVFASIPRSIVNRLCLEENLPIQKSLQTILSDLINSETANPTSTYASSFFAITRNPLISEIKQLQQPFLQHLSTLLSQQKYDHFASAIQHNKDLLKHFLPEVSAYKSPISAAATSSYELTFDDNSHSISTVHLSSQSHSNLLLSEPVRSAIIPTITLIDFDHIEHTIVNPFLRMTSILIAAKSLDAIQLPHHIDNYFSELIHDHLPSSHGILALHLLLNSSSGVSLTQRQTILDSFIKSLISGDALDSSLSQATTWEICNTIQSSARLGRESDVQFAINLCNQLLTATEESSTIFLSLPDSLQIIHAFSEIFTNSTKLIESLSANKLLVSRAAKFILSKKLLDAPSYVLESHIVSLTLVISACYETIKASRPSVYDDLIDIAFSSLPSLVETSQDQQQIDDQAPPFLRLLRCFKLITKDARLKDIDLLPESKTIIRSMVQRELQNPSNRCHLQLPSDQLDAILEIITNSSRGDFTRLDCERANSAFIGQEFNSLTNLSIISYLRFVARFGFFDQSKLNELFSKLASIEDKRLLTQLYESMLVNASLWFLAHLSPEAINKASAFMTCLASFLSHFSPTPSSTSDASNQLKLCVALRNFLSQNTRRIQQTKSGVKIVSLQEFKSLAGTTTTLLIPFPISFIHSIKHQVNVRQFLEQYMNDNEGESNNVSIAVRSKEQDVVILQLLISTMQMQLEAKTQENIDETLVYNEIRQSKSLRNLLQQSNQGFDLLKTYVKRLLTSKPRLPVTTSESDTSISESLKNSSLTASGEKCPTGSVYCSTPVLFLLRAVNEKQSDVFSTSSIVEFLRVSAIYLDLTGVLFARNLLNQLKVNDNQLDSVIESRLQSTLSFSQINFATALNILKSFKLSVFDARTLLFLEQEVARSLEIINNSNLAVLCRKYIFRSTERPTALLAALSTNRDKYLNDINDHTFWVIRFLAKFKPAVFYSSSFAQLSFNTSALSPENFTTLFDTFIDVLTSANRHSLGNEDDTFNQKMQKQNIRSASDKYLSAHPQMKKNNNNNDFNFPLPTLYNQLKNTNFFGDTDSALPATAVAAFDVCWKALWTQLKQQEITLLQFTFSLEILAKRNIKNLNSLPTADNLLQLLQHISQTGFSQQLNLLPCLRTLLRIFQLAKASAALSPNTQSVKYLQIQEQLRKMFIYYKRRPNEKAGDIADWILAFHELGVFEAPKQPAKHSAEDLKILNKLEGIFIRNLQIFNSADILAIFNVYFDTELASFQIFDACDAYLNQQALEHQTDQDRLQELSSSRIAQDSQRKTLQPNLNVLDPPQLPN